jgi:ADP-heptose:LPS heptosyltransferase
MVVWPFRFAIQELLNVFNRSRQPRRIVVIQLAGLGDMLMLTPALATLHSNYPNAKIDFITLHGYVRDAFENHPRLNRITALPAYPGQWIISRFVNRTAAKSLLATMQCYPTLLAKHLFVRYDLGINFALSDFDRSLGNALLYCLNVRSRVGSLGSNDQLLTRVAAVADEPTHRVATYLNFLKPLGISAKSANSHPYEFSVRQIDLNVVKLALRRESVDISKPLAVIHPGGKLHVNSRRWPAEYFARVCEFLCNEGFQIVLTGDDADRDVCEQIAGTLGINVKSIAGRLTFAESAALLSLCQLCITNDTSILHLAEAVQVPRVISIFGPTNPELLAPQSKRHIIFRSKLPCAPCMGGLIDANTERCWREVKEECLLEISPEQVIAVVREYSEKPALHVARA